MDSISKLVSVAGPALCNKPADISHSLIQLAGADGRSLSRMLDSRNGFLAFESALLVYPAGCKESPIELENWNRLELWKTEYGGAADNLVFFAADLFGSQFAIARDSIVRFDPEDGAIEAVAQDLVEWATLILTDYEYQTGYPLARDWQFVNGPIPSGMRLAPTTPFVLGGSYEIDNLYALGALECVRYQASVHRQVRDLPDGTQVRLRVTGNER